MLRTGGIYLLAALGALAGCTPAGGGEAKQPSGAPGSQESAKFDFKEYLRREIEPLPIRKVAGSVLSADVEAAGPPVVTREKGSVKLVIPIGTQGSIDCFVYDERTDGASTVWQIVDAVRKSMEVRLFEPTDVFVAREHPVMTSHAIYFLKKDGVAMGGELKMAYYSHPLVSTMCMHDEAGYSAAFKRITKGLFESLSRSDRELRLKPVKWDIGVFKLNGHPIGYEDRAMYEPKNDTIVSKQISAKLIPRSTLESAAEDSYEIETINRSGELLEFTQVDGNSQGIELQINLKRLGPAQYAYVGKH